MSCSRLNCRNSRGVKKIYLKNKHRGLLFQFWHRHEQIQFTVKRVLMKNVTLKKKQTIAKINSKKLVKHYLHMVHLLVYRYRNSHYLMHSRSSLQHLLRNVMGAIKCRLRPTDDDSWFRKAKWTSLAEFLTEKLQNDTVTR